MAWPSSSLPQLKPFPSLLETLVYSDHFSFPLTPREIWFWQTGSPPLTPSLISHTKWAHQSQGYYFLPGHNHLVSTRRKRALYSQKKWLVAQKTTALLRRFPFISAVFVTGSLAMDNCPLNDDIDVMIITRPHSLWLTRLPVILLLKVTGLRRHPGLPGAGQTLATARALARNR